ncbi:MAG: oprM 1 [Acidobacteria bacterium]|jgi:multidrug efflux system outer membrane protein|nr:oprM 1 [Acidobacteriota bacterium]
MKRSAALLAAVALAACTMIPDYERPAPPVPEAFPGAQEAGTPAAQLDWREFLADERLRAVVEQALAGNRDLRVATLNVERVGALLSIRRSELWPAIGVQGAGQRIQLPEKMTDSGEAEVVERYAVEVGFLSWEIDLFGRLRSLSASALEQYLATEEGERAARSALVAATASSWLRLAADVEALRLAEATLAAQADSLGMIRASRDAGVASDLELRQAESQVEAARVNRAEFAGAIAVDRHALELLMGGPLAPELEPEGIHALAGTAAIASGLPSEVLLARPDILAAEHRLRSANADIGAARAAFFPRISLTAALGTLSPDLSGLFHSGTRTWRVEPVVQTPIFAGGGLRANLRATKIEREIAVAVYEKAIQTAFAEVADGLALAATLAEQRLAQDALVFALEETLRLSEERYRAGIDGYLGVLVAQQALFRAQQSSVLLRFAERANRVRLYKALGGGA